MTKKVLMNRCAALWKKGKTVPEILVEVCCILNEDKPASWLDARIRAWRKIKPDLFPPRHKKHAPRRSKTSFDITLRFDAEGFGEFPDSSSFNAAIASGQPEVAKMKTFFDLTEKQKIKMIRAALRGDNDMLREVDIVSVK